MSPRFATWLATLAPERKNASNPNTWLGVAAVCFMVMTVAGLLPGSRDLFHLRFWPATLCFLPALLIGYVGGWLDKLDRLTLARYGQLLLVDSALLQFYAAALIALSEPPGAMLMASFVVLVAALHGHLHRVSIKYPYGLACTAIALAGALALRPDTMHLYIFAIAGPAALGIGLLLGTWNLRADAQREEQRALREAISAQVLQEQSREQDRLSEHLLTLLEHNHDAGNSLAGLFMNAQMLEEMAAFGVEKRGKEVGTMASAIGQGLRRLRELIEAARHVRVTAQIDRREVEVVPVLDEVIAEVSPVFPGVIMNVEVDGAPTIVLTGGETTLRRILQNLILNACQGNGVRGARRVWIRVCPQDSGGITCECRDDGPGFAREQLQLSVPTAFATTKASGTGLGLYTVQKLVQANRGVLSRKNSSDGGACVSVAFPPAVS